MLFVLGLGFDPAGLGAEARIVGSVEANGVCREQAEYLSAGDFSVNRTALEGFPPYQGD
jgi:hypothetical protein